MKSLVSCLILAAVLMTGGGEARADVTVMGQGLQSCGTWIKDATPRSTAETGKLSWMVGYLSGVAKTSADLDPLNNVDAEGVFAWIDNYCRAHPLETISKAADAFVTAHPR